MSLHWAFCLKFLNIYWEKYFPSSQCSECQLCCPLCDHLTFQPSPPAWRAACPADRSPADGSFQTPGVSSEESQLVWLGSVLIITSKMSSSLTKICQRVSRHLTTRRPLLLPSVCQPVSRTLLTPTSEIPYKTSTDVVRALTETVIGDHDLLI